VLTHLVIENFQSIAQAELELGEFTVITGPTNSGKSASCRALELVAFNRRGTDFIRRGATTCKVATGDREQGWAVGIERGSRGKDAYRLAHQPQSGDEPYVETWTKLGGTAPAEISSALQITPLNFAAQLDGPFLLGESGGRIARTLGELTNVTVVFSAAQAGATRKKALNAELKAARGNAERLAEQERQYESLPGRQQALAEAEASLERSSVLQGRLARLESLVSLLGQHSALLAAARDKAQQAGPPDVSRLEELHAEYARLGVLYASLTRSWEELLAARQARAEAERAEAAAELELHEALVAAGTCPTCGQAVR
jgi:exonuclease SbcC